jgi:PAS domain S-box-containing protein
VVFGAFSLYAGELNAFDEEARELLIEMSADINHALDNFRHDAERKNAEEKLAESERRFRAVTESANDAIITGAGAGAGAGAGDIVGWNTAAERLFGYSEAEIIGQPLTVLMPERFRNLHSAGLARVVAGGTPHIIGKTVELAGLRKDGSEFPLEISLAQWQAADGQFFTATIRDITQRKQTELKLAEQVEELRRWQEVTLGREMRTMELKHEVNELLGQAGQPPRYPSAEQADAAAEGSLRSSGPS